MRYKKAVSKLQILRAEYHLSLDSSTAIIKYPEIAFQHSRHPRECALLSGKHHSNHITLIGQNSPPQTSSSRMRGSRWKKIPRRGHLFIEAFKRLIVNW